LRTANFELDTGAIDILSKRDRNGVSS